MKLYVWTGHDVLKHYGTGHVIAYTDSLETARAMVDKQRLPVLLP